MALAGYLRGRGNGQLLRGTKSSKGPWLQVSRSPQSSWRVACRPLGELRGCQGLSPLRQWHLVLTRFILTPPSPAAGRGPVGSTNSVKLKLALLLGAPISVHAAIFPALRPQPCSSSLSPHIQSTSRPWQLTFRIFPEPALALSSLVTVISHLESHTASSLSPCSLYPTHSLRDPTSGHVPPTQSPPVAPSHLGKDCCPQGPTHLPLSSSSTHPFSVMLWPPPTCLAVRT